MFLETGLQLLREELQLSQKHVADLMGVSQPAVTQLEQRGNDLKIATFSVTSKRWAENLALTWNYPLASRLRFISSAIVSVVDGATI